jgi:hypothetical protein
MPGEIVGRQWDVRGVSRQSQGLRRMQGSVAVREGAPKRRTDAAWGAVGVLVHGEAARTSEETSVPCLMASTLVQ